jgi:hypothetical protein
MRSTCTAPAARTTRSASGSKTPSTQAPAPRIRHQAGKRAVMRTVGATPDPVRLPASPRDRKWVRDGSFSVLGCASLCSLALIAARERTMAGWGMRADGVSGFGAGAGLSCWDGGGLLRGGTGAARGSQAYLGPRALCRARRHDDRLGVLPPAGGCGRSVYSGRPPGPARQDRERLTADWRELAAVMPHRVSSAPARCLAGRVRMGHRGMPGFRRR